MERALEPESGNLDSCDLEPQQLDPVQAALLSVAGWKKLVLSTENLSSQRERHDKGEYDKTSMEIPG